MAKEPVEIPSLEEAKAMTQEYGIAKQTLNRCEEMLEAAYNEHGDFSGSGFYVERRQAERTEMFKPNLFVEIALDYFDGDPQMIHDCLLHLLNAVDSRSYRSTLMSLPWWKDIESRMKKADQDGGMSTFYGDCNVGIYADKPKADSKVVKFGDEPAPKGWEETERGESEDEGEYEDAAELSPGE